jgi:hypothetical protein
MRDGGLPHRKAVAQATTSHFGLLRNVLQDLEPSRICQRLGDPLKLVGFHYGFRCRGMDI